MIRSHFPGGPVFEAVPEPGPLSPEYAAPEPVAPEPAWTGPSQEDWDRVSGGFDNLSQQLDYIAQMAQPQQQQYGPAQPEPLDPLADNFQEQLDAYIEQRLAPVYNATQTWQQSEGTERAKDILGDNISRNGEFLFNGSNERVIREAEAYLPEFQSKYGQTPQAAEAAINAAADAVREYEKAVGEAYHQRQMNQLRRIGEAPRQPGAPAATATQTHTLPPGGDEMSVVRHYGGYGR